jgi:PAS domain S-box-containing protein
VRVSSNTSTSSDPKPLAAAWLAAIVESSDDAIVSKTLDGTITSWNPAAQRLFGYSAEEVIGRPISILAAPDRENEMPANLERIRRGEKVERYETVRRRKDGSLVDISLTVSPIRDETGRIVGASKIARDITARKRVEEHQRMLTAELSHRVKNLFAVVQVLAERSAAKATSATECIEALRGRLQALNAAHNALIAGSWNWASLASLVRTALEPYVGDGDRIRPGSPRPVAQSGFRAHAGPGAERAGHQCGQTWRARQSERPDHAYGARQGG